MNDEIYSWMRPMIEAVQPWCDEPVIAAHTLQGAGGWASGISNGLLFGGLFSRAPRHVRARAGGLPDTIILAVGATKIFVFPYKTKGMRLDVGPPVRVWRRDDVAARGDKRRVASKLTIDVQSTGDHHELESTSMTGRLGKMTEAIFQLLERAAPVAGSGGSRPASGEARRRAGELADELEAELKRIRMWRPDPPSEETVLAGGAFGMQSVPFVTWLQVVLVPRLRQVAAGEMELPGSSSIGTFAVRELDGAGADTDGLLDLIFEIDGLAKRP